ncbi:hypothetical protein BDV26DRAFT_296648 [Aspergillus bertholletiae]|uniref:Uncharacterized protein n=1 Tax=Aspergillus bertholletiae TaxID=1226010 RepID=A0A5N7AXL9_9EURO|nr:hypothetical protein BDV26DRAFT_296648 [Aspergillus bertholletiae]
MSSPLRKQQFHTDSHWSVLVQKQIETLLKRQHWATIEAEISCDTHSHPASFTNFLGMFERPCNTSRRTLLSHVPPRHVADLLVEMYLLVIEPPHQLLHLPSFIEEVKRFWVRPNAVDDGWLALFFAVLAVGSHIYNSSTVDGKTPDTLPGHLCDAA